MLALGKRFVEFASSQYNLHATILPHQITVNRCYLLQLIPPTHLT